MESEAHSQTMEQPEPITVFISYAPEDQSVFRKLETHLSGLKRQRIISTWQKHLVLPGAEKVQEIERQLNTASIILLLISADFIDSDYCYGIEMKQALERHNANNARVIPIIARHCDWSGAPFAQLQCLPSDGEPISSWSDQDLALKDITMQLRKVVQELKGEQRKVTPAYREELAQNYNLQTSLENKVYEQIDNNTQLQYNERHIPQAISKFRRCQENVSELKSIHNMLHEIEVQLEGLSATIQLLVGGERGKKGINWYPSDFDCIKIMWQQVALKIDDLAYFATEGIETLEDERLSFYSNTIKGASWIMDLLIIERSFEEGIRDQNIDIVRKLSNELLTKCRSHLYRIDKRLLEAVKELDLSSHLIIRGKI